jgi:hypothetical protein
VSPPSSDSSSGGHSDNNNGISSIAAAALRQGKNRVCCPVSATANYLAPGCNLCAGSRVR